MSCHASCGELLCRAVSRHDIVRRNDTTWGVSCGVSCHEGQFTDSPQHEPPHQRHDYVDDDYEQPVHYHYWILWCSNIISVVQYLCIFFLFITYSTVERWHFVHVFWDTQMNYTHIIICRNIDLKVHIMYSSIRFHVNYKLLSKYYKTNYMHQAPHLFLYIITFKKCVWLSSWQMLSLSDMSDKVHTLSCQTCLTKFITK